jgi:hypothetical protein
MAMFVSWIERMGVASQQTARRNAMIASTALTQRRAELIEIEDFLASLNESSTHQVAVRAARG